MNCRFLHISSAAPKRVGQAGVSRMGVSLSRVAAKMFGDHDAVLRVQKAGRGAGPARGERGIALVITLVMLAIVTVMAIVFLAVARRERSSVKLMQDMGVAEAMSEAALERAKAEAISKMVVEGSKLHYDLFNSTNFMQLSFDESQGPNSPPNPSNVSYYDQRGRLLAKGSFLRMLANLQYDARPPVFVETNNAGQSDFRFYLDFDRNRSFNTNGILPVYDNAGNQIRDARKNVVYDNFVGDPEWIGVLERPDLPHSETNRFIGRFAYLALPAGKTLDLNFIHNQVEPSSDDVIDKATPGTKNGFTRNQGIGSWEINLAAFLRELNTNNYAWHQRSYAYRTAPNQLPRGEAFDDARSLLAFRYLGDRRKLPNAMATLGPGNFENPGNPNVINNTFRFDHIDEFGDGPMPQPGTQIFFPPGTLTLDNDDSSRPWPGSLSTNAFTDIQQLFTMERFSPGFTNRLQAAARTGKSSYDRYTFYRMAAQLGADSTPALKGKLHLNYVNPVGQITNTTVPWTGSFTNALVFFTNAADLMLRAAISGVTNITNKRDPLRPPGTYYIIGDTLVRTNFSITNIQVYAAPRFTNFPLLVQNEYTPTIHRILQVAANIYDNMTNRGASLNETYPFAPTVFRPIYSRTPSNTVIISGFTAPTNDMQGLPGANAWRDLTAIYSNAPVNVPLTNLNVYGQHLVLGAKKGLPNLNEISIQSYAEVSRKLELVKASADKPPVTTNQMFVVSMLNRVGLEAWNSYSNRYPRPVTLHSEVLSRMVIRDGTNFNAKAVYDQTFVTITNRTLAGGWAGLTNFFVACDRSVPLLDSATYTKATGFGSNNFARFGLLEAAPQFILTTTNKVNFWMTDDRTGHILDYVSFDNLITTLDLSTNLYSASSGPNLTGTKAFNEDVFWDPTPVTPGSPITRGMTNQIAASTGELPIDDDIWKAFAKHAGDNDKQGGISKFRAYMGLGLRSGIDRPVPVSVELQHQTPFVPTRRMHQLLSWQVNDPLVHYMPQDLRKPVSPLYAEKPINLRIDEPLPKWNIGSFNNEIYRPWGDATPSYLFAGQDPSKDGLAYNIAVKDPGIRRSDDWVFPITEIPTAKSNLFASVGMLGQVHRGTPWQTLYLKSIYAVNDRGNAFQLVDPNVWRQWAGSLGTFPSQDWKLLDVFTTAPNENATRGLLSVNQTNRAAWSAVLSGVTVPRFKKGLKFAPGMKAESTYEAAVIEPASLEISNIVQSINFARLNQLEVQPNPNLALRGTQPWALIPRTNELIQKPFTVFEHVGDILTAPALSVQSPYLRGEVLSQQQLGRTPFFAPVQYAWTDRAVEYIPQQILSLLQRDEPRFVVYSFGQSLKPAPHSLTSDPNYFHMCTNYQITGEVITKTTFRVEGDVYDPRNPLTESNPLRAVVESYQVLPPPE